MPKETPGTVCFIEITTTRKVEIMKSSIWFRPLASSSAVLAGIGALVVAAPLTTQGNSIAKSVSSPAYALLSHDGAYDNENDNENENETDNENDDNYANGTHVEDDVYTNGTVGTHVEISDGSNASITSLATGLLTQNQTPAQPRVKWKVRGSAAGSFTSGSSTPTPAVSVAVTGTSAKPAKSAENETSTRSKVRTSRTSAAR